MSDSDAIQRIRQRFEQSHMTVNPGDTAEDLVTRCIYLAAPDNAGKVWFDRWQLERQATKALRKTLADILMKLDAGETVDPDVAKEAWAVLSDVQHIMPEVAP